MMEMPKKLENFEVRRNESDLNTTYTKSPESSTKSDFNGNRESTSNSEFINGSVSEPDMSMYVPATQQVVHNGSTTLDIIPESDVETEYENGDSDAHNTTDFNPEGVENHNNTFTVNVDPDVIDQNTTFNIEPPTTEEISNYVSDPNCKPSPTVKKVKIKLCDTFGDSVVINDTFDHDSENDNTQILIPATQAFNWKDKCVESDEESRILESETEINSTFDLNETYNLPTPKKDLNGTNIVQNNISTLESCSISVIAPVDSQPSISQQLKEKSNPPSQESNKDALKLSDSINPDPTGFIITRELIITRENEVISPINAQSPDQLVNEDQLKRISPAGRKKIPDVLIPAPNFKFPKVVEDIIDDTTDDDAENVKKNSRNKFIFNTKSRKYKEELAILKDIKNPRPSTSLALRRENSRIQKLAQMEERRKLKQESAPFALSRAPSTRSRNIIEPPAVKIEIKDNSRPSKRTYKHNVMPSNHKKPKVPHYLAASTSTSSSDSENDENDKVKGIRKAVRRKIPVKNSRIVKNLNKTTEKDNDNEKDIPAKTKVDTKQEIRKMKINDYGNEKTTLDLEDEDNVQVYTARRGNKRGASNSESQNKVAQGIKLKKTDDNNNQNNEKKEQNDKNVKSPPAKSKQTSTVSKKNSKKVSNIKTIKNVKAKTIDEKSEEEQNQEPSVTVLSPRRLRNRNPSKPEVIVILKETKPKKESSSKAKLNTEAVQVEKKTSAKKVSAKSTKKNPTKALDVNPEPINEGPRRSGRTRKNRFEVENFGTNFVIWN